MTDGGSLWGVLDCARDPGLIEAVRRHDAERECLFEQAPPAVEAAAPWLVRLPDGCLLLERWRREGIAAHWGILFRSDDSLFSLRRELRKHLMVTLPDGRRGVFRFYDPRVMQDAGWEVLKSIPKEKIVPIYHKIS